MWKKWAIMAGVGLVLIVASVIATVLIIRVTRPALAFGPRGNQAAEFGWMGDPRYGFGPSGGFGPMAGRQGNFGPMGSQGYGFGPMMGPGGAVEGGFGPMGGGPGGLGLLGRRGGPANSPLAVILETLDLTRAELRSELRDGKSIAEIAQEREIDLDTIVEAILAPQTERLTELVTKEQLTQQEVDTWLTVSRVEVIEWLNRSWVPQE